MVLRRCVARLAPLAAVLALAATAATAQEIILYEHTRYEGRALHLQHGMGDLRARDFGGRASSVRVISGAWTACGEPGLRGICVVLTGDIPDLHALGFGDRILSVAVTIPVGDFEEDRHGEGHRRWSAAPSITLFDQPRFGGESRTITGPVSTLRRAGFNDRTSSLRIDGGAWEICSDADFRGRCEIFVRSARDLGEARWTDSISSLRPVPLADLPEGWRPLEVRDEPQLVVYEHTDFRGRSSAIPGAIPDLGRIGLKGTISSLKIRSGAWLVCTDVAFRGECRVFVTDQPDLRPFHLNDRIVSIKPAHW